MSKQRDLLSKILVFGVIFLFVGIGVQPVFAYDIISIEMKITDTFKIKKTMIEGNHPPIHIEGNDDFTSENGVTGGSGTEDDPYIIENWIIVGNASYLWGIYIEDSTVHFIIRNCSISGFNRYSAIELDSVWNGKIMYTNIFDNNEGIVIDWGSNNIVEYCMIYNNNCTYREGGIHLHSAFQNIITNNTIINNGWSGIFLYSSSSNFIAYNNIMYNGDCGIYVDGKNNFIFKNNVQNNSIGIYIINYRNVPSYNSDAFNIIDSNFVGYNIKKGIMLFVTHYNTVSNNTIVKNGETGIYIRHFDLNTYWTSPKRYPTNHNKIHNNYIKWHENGIQVTFECANNKIYHNTIIDNNVGVSLLVTKGTQVYENNFLNNSENAFFSTYIFFNIFFDIEFTNNYWDDLIFVIFPKRIKGNMALLRLTIPAPMYCLLFRHYCVYIPWLKYDKNPSREPYDIEV